jgi:peptide chain release factor 1
MVLAKLESIEKRFEELEQLISQPEIAVDLEQLQPLAKERAAIEELVAKYREHKTTSQSLEELEGLLREGLDQEMTVLVKEEMESLKSKLEDLWQRLKLSLLPRDPKDEKDVIVEIRAGAGGDEAGLFAVDLFRMYTRYAQAQGWVVEVLDSSESGVGGFKEVILEVKGRGAFSRLKFERGVHRVQRIPTTEALGRIHTSTVTVAVLPEAEEVEVDISPDDLKIDFYHSRGAGGQNVNKVETAVRITHLPTGIVAACQDERSQVRNRMKAMAVLSARLLDRLQAKQYQEIARERRSQVGGGERAEKIRTYNFPQDRVTDHRIGLTLHNLPGILDGELGPLIEALMTDEQARRLEELLV